MDIKQQLAKANEGDLDAITFIESICYDKLKIIATPDFVQYVKETSNSNWSAFLLGAMYDYGIGIEHDSIKAKEMYEIAVSHNNSNAMNNLAFMCKEKEESVGWFEKAISLGNVISMYNLASMYFEPYTKQKRTMGTFAKNYDPNSDFSKAVKLFEQAANRGYCGALCALGWMYSGIGNTKPDYGKAMFWYQKAADIGDTNAMYALGRMHELGKGTNKNRHKAEEWYNKAIKLNNSDAMHAMGFIEEQETNYTKAIKLYEMAIEFENDDALYNLALMYEFHKGMEKNHEKAMELLKRSAMTGNPNGTESYVLFLKVDKNWIELAMFYLEQENKLEFVTAFENADRSGIYKEKLQEISADPKIDKMFGNNIPNILMHHRKN